MQSFLDKTVLAVGADQAWKIKTPDGKKYVTGKGSRAGYVRLTSDQPLAAWSLCGTKDLTSLCSIPAQEIP